MAVDSPNVITPGGATTNTPLKGKSGAPDLLAQIDQLQGEGSFDEITKLLEIPKNSVLLKSLKKYDEVVRLVKNGKLAAPILEQAEAIENPNDLRQFLEGKAVDLKKYDYDAQKLIEFFVSKIIFNKLKEEVKKIYRESGPEAARNYLADNSGQLTKIKKTVDDVISLLQAEIITEKAQEKYKKEGFPAARTCLEDNQRILEKAKMTVEGQLKYIKAFDVLEKAREKARQSLAAAEEFLKLNEKILKEGGIKPAKALEFIKKNVRTGDAMSSVESSLKMNLPLRAADELRRNRELFVTNNFVMDPFFSTAMPLRIQPKVEKMTDAKVKFFGPDGIEMTWAGGVKKMAEQLHLVFDETSGSVYFRANPDEPGAEQGRAALFQAVRKFYEDHKSGSPGQKGIDELARDSTKRQQIISFGSEKISLNDLRGLSEDIEGRNRIWQELLDAGYINGEGELQDKFNQLTDPDQMQLKKFQGLKSQIFEVLTKTRIGSVYLNEVFFEKLTECARVSLFSIVAGPSPTIPILKIDPKNQPLAALKIKTRQTLGLKVEDEVTDDMSRQDMELLEKVMSGGRPFFHCNIQSQEIEILTQLQNRFSGPGREKISNLIGKLLTINTTDGLTLEPGKPGNYGQPGEPGELEVLKYLCRLQDISDAERNLLRFIKNSYFSDAGVEAYFHRPVNAVERKELGELQKKYSPESDEYQLISKLMEVSYNGRITLEDGKTINKELRVLQKLADKTNNVLIRQLLRSYYADTDASPDSKYIRGLIDMVWSDQPLTPEMQAKYGHLRRGSAESRRITPADMKSFFRDYQRLNLNALEKPEVGMAILAREALGARIDFTVKPPRKYYSNYLARLVTEAGFSAFFVFSQGAKPTQSATGVSGVENWRLIVLKRMYLESQGKLAEFEKQQADTKKDFNLISEAGKKIEQEINKKRLELDIAGADKQAELTKELENLQEQWLVLIEKFYYTKGILDDQYRQLYQVDQGFFDWYLKNFVPEKSSKVGQAAERVGDDLNELEFGGLVLNPWTSEPVHYRDVKNILHEAKSNGIIRKDLATVWNSLDPTKGDPQSAEVKMALAISMSNLDFDEKKNKLEPTNPTGKYTRMVGGSMFLGEGPVMHIGAEIKSTLILLAGKHFPEVTVLKTELAQSLSKNPDEFGIEDIKLLKEIIEKESPEGYLDKEAQRLGVAIDILNQRANKKILVNSDHFDDEIVQEIMQANYYLGKIFTGRYGQQPTEAKDWVKSTGLKDVLTAGLYGEIRNRLTGNSYNPQADGHGVFATTFTRDNSPAVQGLSALPHAYLIEMPKQFGHTLIRFGPLVGTSFVGMQTSMLYNLVAGKTTLAIDETSGQVREDKDGRLVFETKRFKPGEAAIAAGKLAFQIALFYNDPFLLYGWLGVPEDIHNGDWTQALVKVWCANFYLMMPGKNGMWDSTWGRFVTLDRYPIRLGFWMYESAQRMLSWARANGKEAELNEAIAKTEIDELKTAVTAKSFVDYWKELAPRMGTLGALHATANDAEALQNSSWFGGKIPTYFVKGIEKTFETRAAKIATGVTFTPINSLFRMSGEYDNRSMVAHGANQAFQFLINVPTRYANPLYWEIVGVRKAVNSDLVGRSANVLDEAREAMRHDFLDPNRVEREIIITEDDARPLQVVPARTPAPAVGLAGSPVGASAASVPPAPRSMPGDGNEYLSWPWRRSNGNATRPGSGDVLGLNDEQLKDILARENGQLRKITFLIKTGHNTVQPITLPVTKIVVDSPVALYSDYPIQILPQVPAGVALDAGYAGAEIHINSALLAQMPLEITAADNTPEKVLAKKAAHLGTFLGIASDYAQNRPEYNPEFVSAEKFLTKSQLKAIIEGTSREVAAATKDQIKTVQVVGLDGNDTVPLTESMARDLVQKLLNEKLAAAAGGGPRLLGASGGADTLTISEAEVKTHIRDAIKESYQTRTFDSRRSDRFVFELCGNDSVGNQRTARLAGATGGLATPDFLVAPADAEGRSRIQLTAAGQAKVINHVRIATGGIINFAIDSPVIGDVQEFIRSGGSQTEINTAQAEFRSQPLAIRLAQEFMSLHTKWQDGTITPPERVRLAALLQEIMARGMNPAMEADVISKAELYLEGQKFARDVAAEQANINRGRPDGGITDASIKAESQKLLKTEKGRLTYQQKVRATALYQEAVERVTLNANIEKRVEELVKGGATKAGARTQAETEVTSGRIRGVCLTPSQTMAGFFGSLASAKTPVYIDLGTGEGKTFAFGGDQYLSLANGFRVGVITSTCDYYAEQNHEELREVYKMLGVETRYIEETEKNDNIVRTALENGGPRRVVFCNFDRPRFANLFSIHPDSRGRPIFVPNTDYIKFSNDESDHGLWDMRANPAIVSSGSTATAEDSLNVKLAEKCIKALYKDGQIGLEFLENPDSRTNIRLTKAGVAAIEKVLRNEKILIRGEDGKYREVTITDRVPPEFFRYLNAAIRAHKFYMPGRDFLVKTWVESPSKSNFLIITKKYIFRDKATGHISNDMQFDLDDHKAIQARVGAKTITDPGISPVSLTSPEFFKNVVHSNFSGTEGPLAIARTAEGGLAVSVESAFARTRVDFPAVMYRERSGQLAAVVDQSIRNARIGACLVHAAIPVSGNDAVLTAADKNSPLSIQEVYDGVKAKIQARDSSRNNRSTLEEVFIEHVSKMTDAQLSANGLTREGVTRDLASEAGIRALKDRLGYREAPVMSEKQRLKGKFTSHEIGFSATIKVRENGKLVEVPIFTVYKLTDEGDVRDQAELARKIGQTRTITITDIANRALNPGLHKALDVLSGTNSDVVIRSVVTEWKDSIRHFLQEIARVGRPNPKTGQRVPGESMGIFALTDPNLSEHLRSYLTWEIGETVTVQQPEGRPVVILDPDFPENMALPNLKNVAKTQIDFLVNNGVITEARAAGLKTAIDVAASQEAIIKIVKDIGGDVPSIVSTFWQFNEREMIAEGQKNDGSRGPADKKLNDVSQKLNALKEAKRPSTQQLKEIFCEPLKESIRNLMNKHGISDLNPRAAWDWDGFAKEMAQRYGIDVKIFGTRGLRSFSTAGEIFEQLSGAVDRNFEREIALTGNVKEKFVEVLQSRIAELRNSFEFCREQSRDNPYRQQLERNLNDYFVARLNDVLSEGSRPNWRYRRVVPNPRTSKPETTGPRFSPAELLGFKRYRTATVLEQGPIVLSPVVCPLPADVPGYRAAKETELKHKLAALANAFGQRGPANQNNMALPAGAAAANPAPAAARPAGGPQNDANALTFKLTVNGAEKTFKLNSPESVRELNAALETIGSDKRVYFEPETQRFIYGSVEIIENPDNPQERVIIFKTEEVISASIQDRAMAFIPRKKSNNFTASDTPADVKFETVIRLKAQEEFYKNMCDLAFQEGGNKPNQRFVKNILELAGIKTRADADDPQKKAKVLKALLQAVRDHESGHAVAFDDPYLKYFKSMRATAPLCDALYESVADLGILKNAAAQMETSGEPAKTAAMELMGHLYYLSNFNDGIRSSVYTEIISLIESTCLRPDGSIDHEKLGKVCQALEATFRTQLIQIGEIVLQTQQAADPAQQAAARLGGLRWQEKAVLQGIRNLKNPEQLEATLKEGQAQQQQIVQLRLEERLRAAAQAAAARAKDAAKPDPTKPAEPPPSEPPKPAAGKPKIDVRAALAKLKAGDIQIVDELPPPDAAAKPPANPPTGPAEPDAPFTGADIRELPAGMTATAGRGRTAGPGSLGARRPAAARPTATAPDAVAAASADETPADRPVEITRDRCRTPEDFAAVLDLIEMAPDGSRVRFVSQEKIKINLTPEQAELLRSYQANIDKYQKFIDSIPGRVMEILSKASVLSEGFQSFMADKNQRVFEFNLAGEKIIFTRTDDGQIVVEHGREIRETCALDEKSLTDTMLYSRTVEGILAQAMADNPDFNPYEVRARVAAELPNIALNGVPDGGIPLVVKEGTKESLLTQEVSLEKNGQVFRLRLSNKIISRLSTTDPASPEYLELERDLNSEIRSELKKARKANPAFDDVSPTDFMNSLTREEISINGKNISLSHRAMACLMSFDADSPEHREAMKELESELKKSGLDISPKEGRNQVLAGLFNITYHQRFGMMMNQAKKAIFDKLYEQELKKIDLTKKGLNLEMEMAQAQARAVERFNQFGESFTPEAVLADFAARTDSLTVDRRTVDSLLEEHFKTAAKKLGVDIPCPKLIDNPVNENFNLRESLGLRKWLTLGAPGGGLYGKSRVIGESAATGFGKGLIASGIVNGVKNLWVYGRHGEVATALSKWKSETLSGAEGWAVFMAETKMAGSMLQMKGNWRPVGLAFFLDTKRTMNTVSREERFLTVGRGAAGFGAFMAGDKATSLVSEKLTSMIVKSLPMPGWAKKSIEVIGKGTGAIGGMVTADATAVAIDSILTRNPKLKAFLTSEGFAIAGDYLMPAADAYSTKIWTQLGIKGGAAALRTVGARVGAQVVSKAAGPVAWGTLIACLGAEGITRFSDINLSRSEVDHRKMLYEDWYVPFVKAGHSQRGEFIRQGYGYFRRFLFTDNALSWKDLGNRGNDNFDYINRLQEVHTFSRYLAELALLGHLTKEKIMCGDTADKLIDEAGRFLRVKMDNNFRQIYREFLGQVVDLFEKMQKQEISLAEFDGRMKDLLIKEFVAHPELDPFIVQQLFFGIDSKFGQGLEQNMGALESTHGLKEKPLRDDIQQNLPQRFNDFIKQKVRKFYDEKKSAVIKDLAGPLAMANNFQEVPAEIQPALKAFYQKRGVDIEKIISPEQFAEKFMVFILANSPAGAQKIEAELVVMARHKFQQLNLEWLKTILPGQQFDEFMKFNMSRDPRPPELSAPGTPRRTDLEFFEQRDRGLKLVEKVAEFLLARQGITREVTDEDISANLPKVNFISEVPTADELRMGGPHRIACLNENPDLLSEFKIHLELDSSYESLLNGRSIYKKEVKKKEPPKFPVNNGVPVYVGSMNIEPDVDGIVGSINGRISRERLVSMFLFNQEKAVRAQAQGDFDLALAYYSRIVGVQISSSEVQNKVRENYEYCLSRVKQETGFVAVMDPGRKMPAADLNRMIIEKCQEKAQLVELAQALEKRKEPSKANQLRAGIEGINRNFKIKFAAPQFIDVNSLRMQGGIDPRNRCY